MNFSRHAQRLASLVFSASVFVSIFAVAPRAEAAACSANCLKVFSSTLTNLGDRISGIVKLVDESGGGNAARSAVVHAIWTRADGTTFDQYALIGTRMRATFSLYTGGTPGTYSLYVAGATKAGYTFDPVNEGKLTTSITVGQVSNQAPVAVFNTNVATGPAPLKVDFDPTGSVDPDGSIVSYEWSFGDGATSDESFPSHVFSDAGNFTVNLKVTDNLGATAVQTANIATTASNGGCSRNCLLVDGIDFRYNSKTNRVRSFVWLMDENAEVVQDAIVRAVWTLPDGSSVQQNRKVLAGQSANFGLDVDQQGAYKLTVIKLVKSNFLFDQESSNVLSGTIEVSP